MVSTIGIKVANGEFYAIVEENSPVKKRLVLTTVHDKQHSVQIDLYRSYARTMADAQYIGSLVVEKIKPKPKGEPSIELVISSSENGDIIADAIDLDTGAGGEHQVLSVSIKSLDDENRDFSIPDFELEQSEEPPLGLYARAESINQEEKKRFPWFVLIATGIAIILALAAGWYLFLGGRDVINALLLAEKNGRPTVDWRVPPIAPVKPEEFPPIEVPPFPPEPVEPAVEIPPLPPIPAVEVEPPLIEAPSAPPPPVQTVRRERPPAPVSSYKVPAVIPRGGVPYRLRWGDTLWDISEAFYRTPWLYPRIARFNNIRNPDFIIAGRTIRVPPQN